LTVENPNNKVCLITGVGPGTGTALVERFVDGGYQAAMLARSVERLEMQNETIPAAHAFP